MGQNSKIEWTDHTFNPWRGCQHAVLDDGSEHPGCAHCYAEAMSGRNPKALGEWGADGKRVKASDEMWRQPLKWNLAAAAAGVRSRVFCASLADVFEDWPGPIHDHKGSVLSNATIETAGPKSGLLTLNDLRRDLFALIDATPWLDWLLLTKRPGNVRRMWTEFEGVAPHRRQNAWLLTSVSNQATADELVPELLACRDLVPVLGLSAEPLLGPINLYQFTGIELVSPEETAALRATMRGAFGFDRLPENSMNAIYGRELKTNNRASRWLIAGGESGHHARPMHPDWARSLRDQCQAAGVPFFFKQWGEWLPVGSASYGDPNDPSSDASRNGINRVSMLRDGRVCLRDTGPDASKVIVDDAALRCFHESDDGDGYDWLSRVGKKAAGRLLDGREWNEFPQVEAARA